MEAELKKFFEEKNYKRCISILENMIDLELTKKVQQKYPDYKYSTILDMADISDTAFDKRTKDIFMQYFTLLHEYYDDDYIYLDYLMDIYKKVKI